MNRKNMESAAITFVNKAKGNYISEEIALSPELVGIKIFESPIFAIGNPEDQLFLRLKEGSAIGPHFMIPKEWLSSVQSVISFFLPYSAAIKKSNCKYDGWPSYGWLHGRIEGQVLLNDLCLYLQSLLKEAGCESVIPSLDDRFWTNMGRMGVVGRNSRIPNPDLVYTSNWSERHVAYVCGLGTFGLSKGIITSKGVAGRFGSIVTDLKLEPNQRVYDSLYGYCSMCGLCVKRCPVNAISLETGKEHKLCSDFLDYTRTKHDPRYGCGKCQTGVPCENGISL